MKFLSIAAMALGMFVAGAAQSQAAFVIDNYSDTGVSTFVTVDSTTTQNQTDGGVPGAVIAGGNRDVSVDFSPHGPGGAGTVLLSRNGGMNFANQLTNGGNPINVVITYDANGSLGGLDLTEGGVNNGLFLLGAAGGPGLNVTVTVFDGANSASVVIAIPGVLNPGGANVLFSAFNGDTSVFDSATKITLAFTLNKDTGADSISLNQFEAAVVPEPSSIALLGMGVCGLVGYARRRKAANA